MEQGQLLFADGSRRDLNLLLDYRHRLLTSRLMLEACLFRRESRGGHFRHDAPASMPQWECHSRQNKTRGLHTPGRAALIRSRDFPGNRSGPPAR